MEKERLFEGKGKEMRVFKNQQFAIRSDFAPDGNFDNA